MYVHDTLDININQSFPLACGSALRRFLCAELPEAQPAPPAHLGRSEALIRPHSSDDGLRAGQSRNVAHRKKGAREGSGLGTGMSRAPPGK